MESIAAVPLLIIDDFGMRKLPHTAAEDLLEIVMRRYERASTLLICDFSAFSAANGGVTSLPSLPLTVESQASATFGVSWKPRSLAMTVRRFTRPSWYRFSYASAPSST